MAYADDPERPSSAEPHESGHPSPGLEERVARLELDLATLRRQIAAETVTRPAGPRAAAEARSAPPPPPPLFPRPDSPAASTPSLASGTWGATWGAGSTQPPAHRLPESRDSFESRLGSQIFNRIAIVLLMIGTAYFLKLAIDRQWIGPVGRVLAGLVAGTALILWSERFRHKGFAAFSYSLKALGSGVLYLSLWAAFQLFHLLPASVALVLMLLVTAWNAYMAWVQDSELLAAYALAGGFATPLLLSTGDNHEVFLFTYLLAIDLATITLVRLKTWPRLLLGAFPLTVAFFIGWYVEFYAASELTPTSIFIALFAIAFAGVPLAGIPARRTQVQSRSPAARFLPITTLLEDILLPLANAAFVALAFYAVLQDSGHHALLPWLMIVLGAAYLALTRMPQTRTASAIHLSLAVVFLTIAIPLKASGHWITVSWLVEGLALLWVAIRIEPDGPSVDSEETYASSTLRWLASAALLLGLGGILVDTVGSALMSVVPFFGAETATALTGVAVFAAAAWLGLHAARGATSSARVWTNAAVGAFIAIDLIALLLALRELLDGGPPGLHSPFQTADFATALIGLAVFAGVVGVSMRVARAQPGEPFWMRCAAVSTIAFNLIAVLTGVREIDSIWERYSVATDAALQQALAISAFLMLYGAVLLAAGFWKRIGFLRWQALLLLVFTIFKTFLYDMRSLSQGYRVVSFLGLGALLMAISFAYQKDWLALREPETSQTPGRSPAVAHTGTDSNSEEDK